MPKSGPFSQALIWNYMW